METIRTIDRASADAALDAIAAGGADCFLLREGSAPLPGQGRGIRPLLQFLEKEPELLKGAVLTDKIIGKAAAMVAVLGGVREIYALTASESALAFLEKNGVPAHARHTVPHIINRTGDGLCPLEQTVLAVEDPAEALPLLKATIARLMAANAAQQAKEN